MSVRKYQLQRRTPSGRWVNYGPTSPQREHVALFMAAYLRGSPGAVVRIRSYLAPTD